MKEYVENILKGLTAGILSAFLVIYALRPAVPYPEIILEIFENVWMFLILLIINYYIFIWDYHSGAILMLCVIALLFDYIVFTQKGFKKVVKVERFRNDYKTKPEGTQETAETQGTQETDDKEPLIKKLLELQSKDDENRPVLSEGFEGSEGSEGFEGSKWSKTTEGN